MKHPREELGRWIKQANHDLAVARANYKNKFFADACYSAEQSAQKALKGYLYFKGLRQVWTHSVKNLIEACSKYDKDFSQLTDSGIILDQYYIPTRYPDVLAPPAVPFESYTETQATESIELAKKIVDKVKTTTT